MSLLDALLLDPWRDPREIYIALRMDGQRGSGTIVDPFDGGTRAGPSIPGSLTCNLRRFLVITSTPIPGLDAGGSVAIDFVRGPGAAAFNGSFTVEEKRASNVFTILFRGGDPLPIAPPAVQQGYPDATVGLIQFSFSSTDTGARIFWPIAKVSTAPTDLPLAPLATVDVIDNEADDRLNGRHIALGSQAQSFYFRLPYKPAADIAAMDSLVARVIHRFDEVMRAAPEYSVIHLGPGIFDTRGLSSLTNPAEVGCAVKAGQHLAGSGILATTIRLVLPLDEIHQTTTIGAPGYAVDHFQGNDFTVDCNAPGHIPPFGIFPAPVTCGAIGLGGSYLRLHHVRAIHFCTQARAECFPIALGQGNESNPPPVFDVIEDCILEKPGENNTHETTLLTVGGHLVSANGRSLIARNNYINCNYVNDNYPDGVSSQPVAIVSIVQQTATDPELFVMTTKRPHRRSVGGTGAVINNVLINGVDPVAHPLNGSFPVVQKNSDTELVFKMVGAANPVDSFTAEDTAYMGVDFHGPNAFGGTGCVVEGNAVFDCLQGLYTDTGSARDLVVRENYYSNVLWGVNLDFNPTSEGGRSEPRLAQSLTRSVVGGKFIATFTIPTGEIPLQISAGDAVTVLGARVEGMELPLSSRKYNGTFTVLSISPDKSEFTYEMPVDPESDADAPHDLFVISVFSRWQVRRLAYENNICMLNSFEGFPAVMPRSVSTFGYLSGPPFMFPQILIRENLFQIADDPTGAPMPGGILYDGIRLSSADNVLIENNILTLPGDHLVHYIASGTVNAFNNITPAGQLLALAEAIEYPNFQVRDSIESKIGDAILMAFL